MYLITGAHGQLGCCLKELVAEAYFTDKDTLDITDYEALRAYADGKKISAIINCAAYTAVDKAEDEPALAYKINVTGPANLARLAAERDIPIVHISTDYVFGSDKAEPLTEDAPVNAQGVYAKTKLEGEEEVRARAPKHVIIRTSWLYSKYGNNFFKTMLHLGREREKIKVVADQYGTPTYAPDLAAVILEVLRLNGKGVYHFSNEGAASWYDFAHHIITAAGLRGRVTPIKTAEYPTKAVRPVFSVLDKSKVKQDFNIQINHWTIGAGECLKQLS